MAGRGGIGSLPQVPLIVQRIKGAMSRVLRLEFWPEIRRKLWGAHLWSPSYFVVSCGGAGLQTVMVYIQNQGKPKKNGKNSLANPGLKHLGLRER